jgi:gamma-D-glutamyl-L-lysine dipeptidyl-peptidase
MPVISAIGAAEVSHPLESAASPPLLRVRAAIAPLLGEPRIAGGLTSQLTAGHVVTVLEARAPWLHVRGEDGYTGWMHEGYLEAASGDEARWLVTTGAQVREVDGRVRALPFGARVSPQAAVLDGAVYPPETRAQQFASEPLSICRTAESRFVGASYVWGAVTPWGCDCSGFVQSVFRWHGVPLPRDAWQQAEVGQAVAIEATRPADLLFFSDRDDGRITHVAIVLPEHRLVHSALARGGVSVESLDAGDAYVQRLKQQCVGARRVV